MIRPSRSQNRARPGLGGVAPQIVAAVDGDRAVGRQHEPAHVVLLDRDVLHLGRAEQLLAHSRRHVVVAARIGRQRGEPRRGQPVGQPVDAEVGDRGQEDQHLRQHHEQHCQDQQLGGQAEALTGACACRPQASRPRIGGDRATSRAATGPSQRATQGAGRAGGRRRRSSAAREACRFRHEWRPSAHARRCRVATPI